MSVISSTAVKSKPSLQALHELCRETLAEDARLKTPLINVIDETVEGIRLDPRAPWHCGDMGCPSKTHWASLFLSNMGVFHRKIVVLGTDENFVVREAPFWSSRKFPPLNFWEWHVAILTTATSNEGEKQALIVDPCLSSKSLSPKDWLDVLTLKGKRDLSIRFYLHSSDVIGFSRAALKSWAGILDGSHPPDWYVSPGTHHEKLRLINQLTYIRHSYHHTPINKGRTYYGELKEHWAMQPSNPEANEKLVSAAEQGHLRGVILALADGANPNIPASNGELAVVAAARHDHSPIVRHLIDVAGADFFARNQREEGVLWVSPGNGQMRLLIEAMDNAMSMGAKRGERIPQEFSQCRKYLPLFAM